MHIGKRSEQQ